jgi:hypothetical protein
LFIIADESTKFTLSGELANAFELASPKYIQISFKNAEGWAEGKKIILFF